MNKKQMQEFLKALNSIAEEKKVDKKIVIEAMEQAMAAAYKKNEGVSNVEAEVDAETGDIRLYSNTSAFNSSRRRRSLSSWLSASSKCFSSLPTRPSAA